MLPSRKSDTALLPPCSVLRSFSRNDWSTSRNTTGTAFLGSRSGKPSIVKIDFSMPSSLSSCLDRRKATRLSALFGRNEAQQLSNRGKIVALVLGPLPATAFRNSISTMRPSTWSTPGSVFRGSTMWPIIGPSFSPSIWPSTSEETDTSSFCRISAIRFGDRRDR
jgi:hypothetical protein